MKAVKALPQLDQRILILTPIGRDAELTARVFHDYGLKTKVCTDAQQLSSEFQAGAGLMFLTGEALTPAAVHSLVTALEQQPWRRWQRSWKRRMSR